MFLHCVIDRYFVVQCTTAIALSLNTLYLIKWKDEKGKIQNFRLATKAGKKWRDIRMLLNYTDEQLSDIESKNNGNDTQCWNYLMEKWLLSKGTPSYPASWEGLHQMLVDTEDPDIAKLLWTAVTYAVPSPPVPDTNRATQESTRVQESTRDQENAITEPGYSFYSHIY